MRWTKAWFAAAVTASALRLLQVGRQEGRRSTGVQQDNHGRQGRGTVSGAAYKWTQAAALAAATTYQQEQDSIAQPATPTRTWRAEAARHKKESLNVRRIPGRRDALPHGVWLGGSPRRGHGGFGSGGTTRRSTGRRSRPAPGSARCRRGSCLQLYYKWSPLRALAVDDSIRRAQMRR